MIRRLLDTHLLVWAAADDPRLSRETRRLIDAADDVCFSVVSIWEVAIKSGLKREAFLVDAQEFRGELLDFGYREIEVTSAHAIEVGHLPLLHRDPFDRMLLAQARVEGVELLSADQSLARYGAPARFVG